MIDVFCARDAGKLYHGRRVTSELVVEGPRTRAGVHGFPAFAGTKLRQAWRLCHSQA